MTRCPCHCPNVGEMTTQRVRFDAIGLITSDLAASLDFYRHLGLDVPEGAEQQPHVEAVLPGGMRLMWDTAETARAFDPDWTPPIGQSTTLCARCDTPDDVDAVHAGLVAAGYLSATPPFDAPWGQRYAGVRDPDGNVVDLFAWK